MYIQLARHQSMHYKLSILFETVLLVHRHQIQSCIRCIPDEPIKQMCKVGMDSTIIDTTHHCYVCTYTHIHTRIRTWVITCVCACMLNVRYEEYFKHYAITKLYYFVLELKYVTVIYKCLVFTYYMYVIRYVHMISYMISNW